MFEDLLCLIEAVFHQIDRFISFKEAFLFEVLVLGLALIIVLGIWAKMVSHVLRQERIVTRGLPLSPG